MTLTDEIRKELREGLRKGVKYERIRVKFDRDKGSFYNALETVFIDTGAEIESLASERDKIAGQVEKAKSELERIDNENEARERRATELEGRVSELERAEKNVQEKIGKLDRELGAKAKLLEKAENIERLGFTVKKLEKLNEKIAEICAKGGIEPKAALDVFFRDLDSYDAKRGWELELQQLQTLIKTKSSEADRWKAEAKKLELRYAGRKEITDELERLMEQGIRGEDILAWSHILGSVGKTPDEFAEELENYRKLELILSVKIEEVQDLKRKIGVLKSQVATLEKHKAKVEASIKSIADSGVKEIEKVGNEAMGELARLIEQAKRFGEIKAEMGRHEEELKAARYLRVNNPVVIAFFPKEVIVSLLDKVKLWSTLKDVNPKVKLPEWMKEKYPLTYYSGTELELADLLELAIAGLLKAEVTKK